MHEPAAFRHGRTALAPYNTQAYGRTNPASDHEKEFDTMFKKLRWIAAAAIAYLMGFPMAEKAAAGEVGDIIGASISLAAAIIGAAGDS